MSMWFQQIQLGMEKIASFGTGHWTTQDFRKYLSALPTDIQQAAHSSYEKLLSNPQSVGLKPLPGNRSSIPVYSAQVGARYRVLGLKVNSYYIWYWIGTHENYNRMKDMPPSSNAVAIAKHLIMKGK